MIRTGCPLGRYGVIVLAVLVWGLAGGCGRESEPVKPKPRPVPTFKQPTTGPAQGGEVGAGGFVHPPIGTQPGDTGALPPGHPPLEPGAGAVPGMELTFTAPEQWEAKPPRMMTNAVYSVPRVEGDGEDADLAISTLSARIPLARNVERWCGQFELAEGKSCEEATRQEDLEGTAYPTTIVEMSGAYRGMSMGGAPSETQPGFRMLAAEIVAPDKVWYVKLVGPEKTVEHWTAAFKQFVREAK